MVEEAIRNGTWIPPPTRDGPVNPGAKPDMFEAFLAGEKGHDIQNDTGREYYGKKEDVEWDSIMPFSATYLQPQNDPNVPSTHTISPSTPLSSRLRSLFPARRYDTDHQLPLSTITPPASSAPNGFGEQSEVSPPAQALRVAVLIAMPALHKSEDENGSGSGEEDSIPHVEFGVVDVNVGEVMRENDDDAERRKRLSEGSRVDSLA